MKWKIRQEKAGDEAAIERVTQQAFDVAPFADGDEGEIAGRLRDAGALVLSLVAVEGKTIIGHVALSPAHIGDVKCLCLGPLAVRPDRHGRGIGSALVNHAVAVAGAYGRGGVVLTGDPAYYGRTGFAAEHGPTIKGKASKYLLLNGFETPPVGDVRFHAAYGE